MGVDALVERLLERPDLWPALLAAEDRDGFVVQVTELAAGWGLELPATEVHDALVARRREWFSRWV